MKTVIPRLNIYLEIVKDRFDLSQNNRLLHEGGEGFNILKLEDIHSDSLLNVIHENIFYGIIFQTGGISNHMLDEDQYKLYDKMLFFMRGQQLHQQMDANNSRGYLILFTKSFYETFTEKTFLSSFSFFNENSRKHPFEKIEHSFAKTVEDLFDHLLREFSQLALNDRGDQVIWSYLHILLIKIQQNISPQEKGYTEHTVSLLQEFEQYIHELYDKHLSVTVYAEKLNISPNYLNQICKKRYRKNAKRLIDERLLLEAKRSLFSGNMTVSEVAFKLNFKDASYFSRFFRKLTGENPETFRNKHILE